MTRPIRLNAFSQNSPSHLSGGLWRHPDNQSWRHNQLAPWLDLARTLDNGAFDSLFLADSLGVYGAYKREQGFAPALRSGVQVPKNDPMLLVSALAAVTQHLGFGVTGSALLEQPYPFARRMATLDHLSGGRVAWNIVTAIHESASENSGRGALAAHDSRYDVADEFMTVCYKLWEGSWADDAVVRDRERNIYVDPSRVRAIAHAGTHFQVPGIAITEPSPQRTPLLFQAGASERGKDFAATHAEAIFVAAPTRVQLKATVRDIRDRCRALGRDPYGVRIYNMHTVVTAATAAEARAKHDDYLRHVDEEATLVLASAWLGTDLAKLDRDQPLLSFESNAMRSVVEALTGAYGESAWTVDDIVRFAGLGALGPLTVGAPGEVADELQQWQEDTDVDGFNIGHVITPGSFIDFNAFVVPELRRRGAIDEARGGTLRHRLFGRGDRLQAPHPAAGFRFDALP